MRKLTEREFKIIELMLDQLGNQKEALMLQARAAKVDEIDEEGSLHFNVLTQTTEPYDRVPVTAIFDDADGIPIYLLLHVVDGKLHELEIYKADGSRILETPSPRKIYF